MCIADRFARACFKPSLQAVRENASASLEQLLFFLPLTFTSLSMFRLPLIVCLYGVSCLPLALSATTVGAYWAFQTQPTTLPNQGGVDTQAVSVNTLLNGIPSFSMSGSRQTSFGNFGPSYDAHDGSTWDAGRAIGWNVSGGPSTGNQFEITLNTYELENLSVRLKYRLNSVETAEGLMSGFSAFQYKIGNGSFASVPGVSLALVNDASWNNEWTADLSALAAIEDAGSVTLRWQVPDLVQGDSQQIRIDDIEILGTSTASNRVSQITRQKYNVLFLAVDDLKPMIGAFGDPIIQTPNMDRLAATGISFANAHCQYAICNASRVSVMTGLRTDTTKTWQLETKFRQTVPNVVTLPEYFRANGYTTKGIGKIYHGMTSSSQDETKSWSDGWTNNNSPKKYYGTGPNSAVAQSEDSGNRNASSTDRGVFERDGVTPVDDQSYSDGLNSDYAIARLAEYADDYNNNGTPFFLALGFQKPHLPFNCPEEYWALYDAYMAAYDLSHYTGVEDAHKASVPIGSLPFTAPYSGEPSSYSDTPTPPTIADARRLIHGYLACVSYIDNLLGEVLQALEDEGLADNTIVVLWGDHGFHLADHDGWWAKHTNYEQATRSPLIVRTPGMQDLGTAGALTNTPMELVDIYPTLIDLCGLPKFPQPQGLRLEGESFVPLLEDVNQPWRKAAFSAYRRVAYGNNNSLGNTSIEYTGNMMGYTARTERYRYTEWWATDGSETIGDVVVDYDEKLDPDGDPVFVELYDYLVDPAETVNLATDTGYTAIKNELKAILDGGHGWSQTSVAPPVEYPSTVAEWQARHLITGYSSTDFDLSADPDADNILNIFEYVMGTHPLSPDFGALDSFVDDGDLVLEYNHVPTRTDVALAAKTTSDLVAESWTAAGVTESEVESFTNHSRRRASIPVDSGASGFLRLEADSL